MTFLSSTLMVAYSSLIQRRCYARSNIYRLKVISVDGMIGLPVVDDRHRAFGRVGDGDIGGPLRELVA
jgi:hypothetical protein